VSAAIQAMGLTRRIEGAISRTLINHVDLTVEKGEFVTITGPSGSGKSSLLYLLGLLDAPTEGDVSIFGQSTSNLTDSQKADLRLKALGFVFQSHYLLPEFTALNNVLMPMKTLDQLSSEEMHDRGIALLTSLGLGDQVNKRPFQLSGGQCQRVAIARALANDPEIIMGDEPTGNLDSVSTEQVFNILQDLSNKGRTVCVVTHDLGLAARADRQIRLVDGKIEKITVQRKTAAVARQAAGRS
jgi:lipoprotein-releasing system ATP-binding protein